MKVLLALAFLLWLGADAQHNSEQHVRYPPEHVERRYIPGHSLRGPPFVPGKTHRYELTINVTAGVPGLTGQVAKSFIHLDVSILPRRENEYFLKAEHVEVSESRSSVDSGEAPLPLRSHPELERDLSQPIRFIYEDGEVKSYTLGYSESLPSRSIKRAILRHLQMKLKRNPHREEDYPQNYPVTYSTTERDEVGPYEAIYTVNVSPYPEFPYEDKVYNITRVHNYEPYGYPAYYERHNFAKQGCPEVYKAGDYPPYNRYGAGYPGYEPYQTPLKASKIVYHNLRYAYGKYVLENIQVEEKSVAALYDQDLVVSIESQYVLKEVSGRRFEEPRERQREYTHLYTAPTEEELRRELPRGTEEVTREYQFVYGIFGNVRPSELVVTASRILEKVSTSVVAAEIETTRAQEVTEDIANLQDVLSLLRKTQLDAVYRNVPDIRVLRRVPEKEKVKRQIFLDVLPLVGTDDSVEYIKYLIQERKLSVYEAKEVLEAIPANLIEATEKNVQDLLALTDLSYVKQHHVLHSAAYLTVSSVIREAYVVPLAYGYYDEEDRSRYDTQPGRRDYEHEQEPRTPHYYSGYDNEIHIPPYEQYPGSYERQQYRYRDEFRRYGEITLRRYVQDVRSKLKSATKLQEKVVYIEALAHLGYKKSLQVLKPYVYGYAADTEDYAPGDVDFLKTVALYSLHNIIEYYPEETQEVVAPVYFNRAEAPRVRIAAFSVLLRSQPSLGLLQHVAQDSYDEPSYEVGSYVYSALEAYGNASTPCLKLTADRIRKVISQVKSYDIGKQYSKSVIKTFFDELRNFGIEKRFAVVQSNESFIPTTFYTSLEYHIQAFQDVLYQAKLNVQGLTVEDLLKAIDYEVLGLKPPHDIPEGVESSIFRGLRLLPRVPKELRLAFYRKIFYSSAYHYVDAESLGSYIFPLVDYVQDYLTTERGLVSGHFVKTYIPSSYQSLTYSSVGFPVDFRTKHPLVVSLKVESRRPHRASPSAHAFYIRPSVYYGTYYKHSIFHTAVQHAYGVYQEQRYTATYPFELSFYVDDEHNTFEVSYKIPEVPKRVYRSQSEAGTYESELKLRYVLSAEENRDPIQTIPALFQREYVVNGFGFPSLYVSYHTEDIQDEYAEYPQDFEDLVELIVEAYHNPGFWRKDVNVTVASRPSSAVDQVKFTFSYNRTYDARSESQRSPAFYHSPHDSGEKDFSRSRHMTYATSQERSAEDEYTILSRIFPQKQIHQREYEDISAEQAHRVHEAFAHDLSNVAHEFYFRVETSPSVNVAELKVEYNHTFDKTLHNVRAEVAAYSSERRTPYKVHLAHVMRYVNTPNAFHYDPRAYVGQYASFFNAITFGERPRNYEQSDVIAKGAFVKVPAEQHFSREEFAERPGREAFLPDAYEECQRDVQEGKSLSPACIAAVEEDARLNKVFVRVTARQDLPPPVQNLTYKLENAIKYYYHDQVEVNSVGVRNPPRTFEMVINYIDKLTDKPVLDVYMKKPAEEVVYHKVDFEYLEALSSVHTLRQSYKLKSTNYTYPPFCGLTEKYVKTYDKKVYPLPRNGCTYLLSTHCTEKKKFAVFAKRVSPTEDFKEVHVYVADKKVVLKPERTPAGVFSILYNDRPVEVKTPVLLDEENLLYVYPIAVHDDQVKYILVLRAEKTGVKVEYDGKNVKLQVSPVYKGELCGLCSEFDGEITREYVGPNQYLYVDSEDFAYSSVVDADVCGVSTEPKNPVLRPYGERRLRQRHVPYPTYDPYNYEPTGRPRYPYHEEDESEERPRYPYHEEDESEERSRYPYTEDDTQDETRYRHTDEEDYERRPRYPYDEQDESYPSRRADGHYPYYDRDQSYRRSRDEYSRQYRYPYDQDESYRKFRYPYYDEDESSVRYRYPYDERDSSSEEARYTRDDEEETYKKSYHPYEEEEEYFSRRPRYPYDDQKKSYEKHSDRHYSSRKPRHVYDDQYESSVKSRYPYSDKYEQYEKSDYTYNDQDESKYRYPYDPQDEFYRRSSYPYEHKDELDRKEKYLYDEHVFSPRKSRNTYDEQDESYERSRYPYERQVNSSEKYRYPYHGKEDSYEKFSKRSGYAYADQRDYNKRPFYPYDDQDSKSRYPYDSSRYPYGEQYYSRIGKSRYPYDYQEKSDSYETYPYDYEDKSYSGSDYPYFQKDKSYDKENYPYDYQGKSYREFRHNYGYQGNSYDEEKYPNGYEDKSYGQSRYPYGYKEKTYSEERYPYGYESKFYRESRYPYRYEDKTYREGRYPYSFEDKTYGESRYPYRYKDETYDEERYPYGYEDKSYRESRYPYRYEDKQYSEDRYPYSYENHPYSEERYPYDYEGKSYRESRYPFFYKVKRDAEEKYPYRYEDKSYSEERYPYVKDKKSSYPKVQSYDESRYQKAGSDDSYERKSTYPTSDERPQKKLYYAGQDDERTTQERGADVKVQPTERTVYVERGEKTCFSTQPVPVCEEGYKPTEEYQKTVGYHCLPKDDVTTKRFIAESKERVLRELSSKKVDYTEAYTAARYCAVY